MLIMFVDLVIAGLIQGFQWRDLVPWEQSIVASRPFWILRSFTGIMVTVGQVIFICNVVMTAIHRKDLMPDVLPPTPEPEGGPAPAIA
jgi:cytochrome c oxidase cbb3-type subunit 1